MKIFHIVAATVLVFLLLGSPVSAGKGDARGKLAKTIDQIESLYDSGDQLSAQASAGDLLWVTGDFTVGGDVTVWVHLPDVVIPTSTIAYVTVVCRDSSGAASYQLSGAFGWSGVNYADPDPYGVPFTMDQGGVQGLSYDGGPVNCVADGVLWDEPSLNNITIYQFARESFGLS